MESASYFLGRFHPLLVHLPIGILLLAFFFECVSFHNKYKKLKAAVKPSLLAGAFFAILSCITGFFLKQEGGYPDNTVNLHQYSGIATAVFATLLYVLAIRFKTFYADPVKRKRVRLMLFIPLVVLVSVTGHLGGSLTHGEEYLFASPFLSETEPDPAAKIRAIADIDSVILFKDVIRPVVEAHCFTCHSSGKQKGQLRLDHPDFILHGGKHGAVLIPGLPDSSELYKRLMLPLEDEHHMPPNERPQLTSTEIALIMLWIEEGANFEKPVYSFANSDKIKTYLSFYKAKSGTETVMPDQDIREADGKLVQQLKDSGLIVMPVGSGSNYLRINFVNARTVNDDVLRLLSEIRDHIVWLNLGHTNISSEQLKMIGTFKNLHVLYLNDTPITDEGIKQLVNLSSLRFLNLVNTRIRDQSFDALKAIEKLQRLYLYQTDVTSGGIEKFTKESKIIELDTGKYQLQVLPTDTIVFKPKI